MARRARAAHRRVSSIAWPSRALPSFERCERPSEPMARFGSPARRLGAGAGREIGACGAGRVFRRAACRRRPVQSSSLSTLLTESTRRVGTAWPARVPKAAPTLSTDEARPGASGSLFDSCGVDHRLAPAAESSAVRWGTALGALLLLTACIPRSDQRAAPPRPQPAARRSRQRGRFAKPGHTAMPYRSRPRTDRLSGPRRPPLRAAAAPRWARSSCSRSAPR